MRTYSLLLVTVLVVGAWGARADVIDEFLGFQTIAEMTVSGLESSYHDDVVAGLPISGPTTGSSLPFFGPDHVSYPHGVGEVPSPGGSLGQQFDEGVLGVKVEAGDLVIQLASTLDPLNGYYHSGFKTWYGQGDVFLNVADSGGIGHFALLNSWARDDDGDPISLNRGRFDNAAAYHVSGGSGGGGLEGHLVQLAEDQDVALTGGRGAYNSNNAPDGLDIRAFAQGGVDLADAGLLHETIVDPSQTWYLQTWTVDLGYLSADASFDVGLHVAASCGNDQIGGALTIPEPGSMLLMLAGVVFLSRMRRR